MVTILPSDICSATKFSTIGSKVIDRTNFMSALQKIVASHDFTSGTIPGQAYIKAPELIPFVSSGTGKHTNRTEDYVIRQHRGKVGTYLKRTFAEAVDECAVVVYTIEAYGKDPEVNQYELEGLKYANVTHVLVALLASSGKAAPLTPYRLVSNLAGGNREALVWDADTIRAKAKETIEYYNEWTTVAD